MASIGIARLDDLFEGSSGATPVTPNDNGEIVGVIQELLRNHDIRRRVPGPRNVTTPVIPGADLFGTYGGATKAGVKYFQEKHGLPVQNPPVVDSITLRQLIIGKASKPSGGRAFLTRKLDFADSVLSRVVSLISSWEENVREGGFRNWKPQDSTDAAKTGLSYGLLQWTHGSTRLGSLLTRLNSLTTVFNSCFGVNAAGATEMITHATAGQTVLANNGDPVDTAKAHLNFQNATLWKAKFVDAGERIAFQILQVEQAFADLRAIHTAKRTVWTRLRSQRSWGFMLDMANQRGEGGANSKYTNAVAAFPTPDADPVKDQDQLLKHMEDAETAAFQPRRHFFRVDSPLPANVDFPVTP